ncbi:MAG: type II toxin-antitoxin system VapC family toxin [Acidimicrobiales bacterium]
MALTADKSSVVDASVLVDALVVLGESGARARDELVDRDVIQVPAIFRAEATSALRGLVLRGKLSPIRAETALEQVRATRTIGYPFEPFMARAWELRGNLTVYDAWYVALAEWLEAELVTADDKLVNAPGPRCVVRPPRARGAG